MPTTEVTNPITTDRRATTMDLLTPGLAVANRYLLSVNMKATPYTLDQTTLPAGNPPRNVTITHTAVGAADTLGNLIVTGTNFRDEVITETIAIVNGSLAAGVKAFKTVTALSTPGWVINEGNDTIVVGFGNLLGLSRRLSAAGQVFAALLGAATLANPNAVVSTSAIESNTVDLSAATYDGAKSARLLIRG